MEVQGMAHRNRVKRCKCAIICEYTDNGKATNVEEVKKEAKKCWF